MDFLAFRSEGFWPAIWLSSSSKRAKASLLSAKFPTPEFTTTFFTVGTSMTLPNLNSFTRAGATSFLYFSNILNSAILFLLIQNFPTFFTNSCFLSGFCEPKANSSQLFAIWAHEYHRRNSNRPLNIYNPAFFRNLTRLNVLFQDIYPFDQNLSLV